MRKNKHIPLLVACAAAGLALGYYAQFIVEQKSPPTPTRKTEPTRSHSQPDSPPSQQRGASLAGEPSQALLNLLISSPDRITARKAAKTLGDQGLLQPKHLAAEQQQALRKIVFDYLGAATSASPEARSEGRLQIQRLWQLAAPALLDALDSENSSIREAAANSLITMADEGIVQSMVTKAMESKNPDLRFLLWNVLAHLDAERPTVIPGRAPMPLLTRKRLLNEVVRPAMEQSHIYIGSESGERSSKNAKDGLTTARANVKAERLSST